MALQGIDQGFSASVGLIQLEKAFAPQAKGRYPAAVAPILISARSAPRHTRTRKRGHTQKGSSLLLTHKLNPVTRFICPGRFEYNIQTHGIT